jgi:rubrerythrin
MDYGGAPPPIPQPNIFPLHWESHTKKLEEIWDKAQQEVWDPAKLPWDKFDPSAYTTEQREAIAYWWGLLSVFDASGPPVFAQALVRMYELHEEDPARRAFFSIERDEQNHEQVCGMVLQRLTPGFPDYEPQTETGRLTMRNMNWMYHNGARYWDGYKDAIMTYDVAVVFSSFLMGEVAAATLFQEMAANTSDPLFREAFSNIGRDEGRHMAICMSLMERDYPQLSSEQRQLVTKQIKAGYAFLSGVLFEPPMDTFWQLPPDFLDNQHAIEDVARSAGFGIPSYEDKKENWRQAMLNVKSVLDRYDIPFPAIPEVGIEGEEVTEPGDIIPVF